MGYFKKDDLIFQIEKLRITKFELILEGKNASESTGGTSYWKRNIFDIGFGLNEIYKFNLDLIEEIRENNGTFKGIDIIYIDRIYTFPDKNFNRNAFSIKLFGFLMKHLREIHYNESIEDLVIIIFQSLFRKDQKHLLEYFQSIDYKDHFYGLIQNLLENEIIISQKNIIQFNFIDF
jgi:hypothetical protein